MKLIAGAFITVVLLAGCSSVSVRNSDEILQAKSDACKSIMVDGIGGVPYANIVLFNNRQLLLFDRLAKLDEKYMDISFAVHYGYLLANRQDFGTNVSENSLLAIEYKKQTAQIATFCGAL